MLKIKQVLLLFLMVSALAACGDKDGDPEPGSNTNTKDEFLPMSVGSTWTYQRTIPTTPTPTISSFTQTVLSSTKTIDGKVYREVETKQGNSTAIGWTRNENGVYTSVASQPSLSLTFLKVNEPAGSSWEQTDVINGTSTKNKFTLVAKGLTKTIDGKEYKDMIHLRLNQTLMVMGMEVPMPPTNYYYARGIGLVLTELPNNQTIVLKSYSIK